MSSNEDKKLPTVAQTIGMRGRSLSPSLQRVATYIDQHPLDALTKSAAEIAVATGTSDATVVRAVQALGFDGLPELRRALAVDFGAQETPSANMSRTFAGMPEGADAAIDFVLATHADGLGALKGGTTRAQISLAVALLSRAKRVAVFGVGPSALLAQYFVLLLARNGRAAVSLDARGLSLADQLLQLRPGDAVLMMAYGRAYGEAGAVISEAKRLGLSIVLLTDSLDEKLSRHADLIVPVTRGRTHRVALHGATFACLEAIMLGIAASDETAALAELDHLARLRKLVAGGWSEALGTLSAPEGASGGDGFDGDETPARKRRGTRA